MTNNRAILQGSQEYSDGYDLCKVDNTTGVSANYSGGNNEFITRDY